jgi:hypothetical protein
MTISDPDIWRAAQLIARRHGTDARIVAAQRADELFKKVTSTALRCGSACYMRSRSCSG